MAKQARSAMVPKLRFPEFLDREHWEEKALKTVCAINPANDDLPESFIYIDLESVDSGVLNTRKRIQKRDAPSRAQRLLRNGDVVFQIVRPYQRNNLFVMFDDGETYVASTGYAQLRAKDSEAFLYQVVHTDNFVEQVIAKCTGSNYPAINSSDLADVPLPVPPTVREQQKIAECLTSLDEVIAAQARKVAALKTYKRGLMQQLFPREGETIPRLRFPEFHNAPEWREARLNSLGVLVSGLTYNPDDVQDSGLLVLRSSNVQNAEIALDDNVYVTASIKGANLVKPNDILICVRNGSKALIGKSALIPDGMPLCTHGAFMTVFRAHAPQFVFQLMQSALFQKQVAADLGATINSINGSQLLKYRFLVPDPDEQKRIAEFLSTLSNWIAAEAKKLTSLKIQKNGLMQQLFPSPEAI